MQNLNLTQTQRDNLVAFLNTLTGTAVYADKKWSSPFDVNDQLSLIILPSTSMTIQNNGNGTANITCNSVPGFQYQLESSSDLKIWSVVTTVTPDANGKLQQTINGSAAPFYRFSYTPP